MLRIYDNDVRFAPAGSKEFLFFSLSLRSRDMRSAAADRNANDRYDPGWITCPLNEVKGPFKIPCCRQAQIENDPS